MPFLGLDDNEQVEREGCRSLEFVRRCFVGPHVGVRKAGLVSTSACTPLGAVLFCGVVSAGNPNDCHDDSDACPLGRCSVDTGYHRASSETVYPRLHRNEIHHWCAVGQELVVIPLVSSLVEPLGLRCFLGSSIMRGTLVFGKPLHDPVGECNLSVTRSGMKNDRMHSPRGSKRGRVSVDMIHGRFGRAEPLVMSPHSLLLPACSNRHVLTSHVCPSSLPLTIECCIGRGHMRVL